MKRMLTKEEAAEYSGFPKSTFPVECPVRPVELKKNRLRYDRFDIDKWIDAIKRNVGLEKSVDDVIREM